jgi:sugar lactone lactonase YvrE
VIVTLIAMMAHVPVAVAQRGDGTARVATDSTWQDHRIAARDAYNSGNFAGYRSQLLRLYDLMSGSPQVVYSLAVAEAKLHDEEGALGYIAQFASMGLTANISTDSAFASLRDKAQFQEVLRRMERNESPTSRSSVAFKLPEADMLSEDISYDQVAGQFFVSSVRKGKIVAVGRDSQVTDFITSGSNGVWGILAVAVDPVRRVLWATTLATPMTVGFQPSDSGRTALLQYDLGTHKLLHRYDLPVADGPHALGDMTVSSKGDVYVSDGAAGIVYVLRGGSAQLTVVVAPGDLPSPQTPVLSADELRLYVADYIRGIAIVDLSTGAVSWLSHPKDLAVSGIDGLYRSGNTLFAIQNGTSPERVIQMKLDATGKSVVNWDLIEANSDGLGEPTHGVIVESDFYFIANSGWDRLERDGTVRQGGFTAPFVRRFPLGKR